VQNCVFEHQFPVHPHSVVICTAGAAREKKRRTPPNEIAQLTDHAISRTNNVLRFWFVINTKFKRRSLHGNKQGQKNADHVRDWKNVKSSQQRTRFTVTDHSSRLQTGTPFLAFQQSAMGERKHPLSNELDWKNKQTPRNKPPQLTDHAFSQTNGVVRFSLERNTKFEQRNPHESDKGGEKNTHT
jgi:hypothetical protein